MEDDASQEEKQKYLKENILEKGYDASKFVEFLQSKKGEAGSDITNWSMENLSEVVQEFISKNSPSEKEKEPQSEPEPVRPQKKETVIQNKSNNDDRISVKISRTQSYIPTLTDEDYGLITSEFLKCQKSETTELSKYDNIEISVNDPKKIGGGFFSKAFIIYLITTNPLKISVRRKHDNFVWLRERLSIIYNLNILPRLPKKGKVNEDKHINKRMRNLEKFLNYLIKDPLIKSSNLLFDFLTIEEEKDFEKRKKIYNKMKTPIEIKDIKSIDGKIKINVSPNKEIFLDNIKANSAFNETCLKQFNTNFKLLKEEMNSVIGRVSSFGPLFDKLIKISNIYLENDTIIESYKQMKNIFTSCVDMLKRQSGFFYNDVKEYLKLLGGNYHHIRDLVQIVETLKINYNKEAKNLITKKNDLFRKGDTDSWQLDIKDRNNLQEFYFDRIASYQKICAKDTKSLIKVKEKYGYHLNKIISEFQRMRNINTVEHKNKVVQFATKESEIISDFSKILSEIIEDMNTFKDSTNKGGNIGKKVKPTIDLNIIDKEENNISKKEIDKNENKINIEINKDKKEENKDEILENNNYIINEKENTNDIKVKNKKKIKEEDKNEEKKEDNIDDNKEEDNKNEIEDKKEESREENINGRNESKDNMIEKEEENKKGNKKDNKDEIKEKSQININKEDNKNDIDNSKNKDKKDEEKAEGKKEEEKSHDEKNEEGKKEEEKEKEEKNDQEKNEELKKEKEKNEEKKKEEEKKEEKKKEEEKNRYGEAR